MIGKLSELQKEKNEQCTQRHELAVERLRTIVTEETVNAAYISYFQDCTLFLLELENTRKKLEDGSWDSLSLEEKRSLNRILYSDIIGEKYQTSYANQDYACEKLGQEMGQLLSLLYTEIRAGIPYVFEQRKDYLTILYELFLEVYTCFEGMSEEENPVPKPEQIKEILYWYASDYCDVFYADRILEQMDPSADFAVQIIEKADLDEDDYLYEFGEYISKNELGTAHHLRNLPQETLQKMADVYTEGYRVGFINTGKDLSKKSIVNIRYSLGFEKVICLAIENFRKMGLKPVIYRAASSVITKREHHKIGYYGAIANQQYEYDHRQDQALFMDKRYVERKLEVMKTVFEQNKEEFETWWNTSNLTPLDIVLEQLVVYFISVYLLGAVYDENILGKVDACIGHTIEIYLLLLGRWLKHGELAMDDVIEVVYRYSREIEHSDENLERAEMLNWFAR